MHRLCVSQRVPRGEGDEAMGYEELLVEVRKLVRESIEARYRGELHVHKVRAQAYADGYMRALSDAGLVTGEELLQAVAAGRADVSGAALDQRSAESEPRQAAAG